MVNKLCPETRVLIRFYKNETELSYRKIATRCGSIDMYLYLPQVRHALRLAAMLNGPT